MFCIKHLISVTEIGNNIYYNYYGEWVKRKWQNKTAIHFGINNALHHDLQFDGEKDADYFHLFGKAKRGMNLS